MHIIFGIFPYTFFNNNNLARNKNVWEFPEFSLLEVFVPR